VIGRLCTPTRAKWPDDVSFYAALASRFPNVRWEFVGCPAHLQPELQSACGGRAAFFPAGWQMRSRLWHWDALLYHNAAITESFGRTVAEAMRAGCIPIVDDRGGFREQIIPSCGFLCHDDDEFAAATAMIQSTGTRQRMSRACRAHADERFSLRRFGMQLLERLSEACQDIAPAS
jgi:glycosyltransferase involved in cell wall biosynthesis